MPAPANTQPSVAVQPPAVPPPRPSFPRDDQPATPLEQQKSRDQAINDLIRKAVTPAGTPSLRPGGALGAAERAIAPLAETIDAIDEAISVVVENLRNADIAGYKVSRTIVGDTRAVSLQLDASPGELLVTQRALDIAIQGEGFLPVRIFPNDEPAVAYTRNGRLFMDSNGDMVVGDIRGYLLIPEVKFPPGVSQITITPTGDIRVAVDHQAEITSIGQISLALFTDPSALEPLGGGLYRETATSGRAVHTPPGSGQAGRIVQGHLESSNLDVMREGLRLRFLQNWRAKLLAALEQTTGDSR